MFLGQTVTLIPRVSKEMGGEENLFLPPIIEAGIRYTQK
jgi:hypothetical protein